MTNETVSISSTDSLADQAYMNAENEEEQMLVAAALNSRTGQRHRHWIRCRLDNPQVQHDA